MRVAINRCFGGFQLSHQAMIKLVERGWRVTVYNEDTEPADPSADLVDMSSSEHYRKWHERDSHYCFVCGLDKKEIRTNPDIIAVIEELGELANTSVSELKIVEVPDDIEWTIGGYDGLETVQEAHRTWA